MFASMKVMFHATISTTIPPSLPWIDLVGLALVVVFLVFGALRGLWWQVVRLLGLIASVAVARALAPRLGSNIANVFRDLDPRVANGLVWFVVFAAGLLVVALIGRAGKAGLEAAQLGPLDRVGGALAGAVSGIVVHCVLIVCITQIASPAWSGTTVRGTHSQALLDSLGRSMPSLLDAHAAEVDGGR